MCACASKGPNWFWNRISYHHWTRVVFPLAGLVRFCFLKKEVAKKSHILVALASPFFALVLASKVILICAYLVELLVQLAKKQQQRPPKESVLV